MPGAVALRSLSARGLGLGQTVRSVLYKRSPEVLAASKSTAARKPPTQPTSERSLNGRRLRCRAAAIEEDVSVYSGESFYDILGVAPDAGEREIKKSYYGMMRECHPDLSQDDESVEFCKMLNDIYETLMDPGSRALYDDLAGYSDSAINPFLDTDQERDLVFVDEFTCIGCRNCNNVCSRTFEMEEEWGRARVMRQRVDSDAKLQEAIDTCPVSCIHWVSAPQLSLLEAAMARMERVAVWSLMSGGGANRDVFNEASIAWEKRYANTRTRLEVAAMARQAAQARAESASSEVQQGQGQGQAEGFGGLWERLRNGGSYEAATSSRFYEKARSKASASARGNGAGAAEPQTKEVRSIAALAARAARASRSWKVYQSVVKKGALQLTATSSEDEQ